MNLDTYEINRNTCAVLNVGTEAAKIIEGKGTYLLEKKTYEVMEDSCAYYGSTYDGRLKGTKMILGSNYKLPIVIEDSNDIIFFPTNGNHNDNCSWISLKHVEKYVPYKGYTKVTFDSGKTIIVKMSCSSFETQLFRAMRLRQILNDRYDRGKKSSSKEKIIVAEQPVPDKRRRTVKGDIDEIPEKSTKKRK